MGHYAGYVNKVNKVNSVFVFPASVKYRDVQTETLPNRRAAFCRQFNRNGKTY